MPGISRTVQTIPQVLRDTLRQASQSTSARVQHPMSWPPEHQRASVNFEKSMVAACDHAGLATTNMVEGVLHAFGRRLSLELALRFADQWPPAARGLFTEGRRPGEQAAGVGNRTEMLAEVRSLRHEHISSPDNAIESVGFALFTALPSDAFARGVEALPSELRELGHKVGQSA